MPHDGVGITAAQVQQMIDQGVREAMLTRAQIRLPRGERTRMIFAVADKTGTILGLFRMPDSPVFSIDVSVAKARNASYYADRTALNPLDQVPGIPRGIGFTARTFRELSQPRFPEGVDGQPPGPFSTFLERNINRKPAANFRTVLGFDSFNPQTNFRNRRDIPQNQNGIIFFPGSTAIYQGRLLLGGFGVSGDGVDQDDVVTAGGARGFLPPASLRADAFFFRRSRLPYFRFPRNPRAF
jgi:uncharacterized protein GlcG (DUF336 family)